HLATTSFFYPLSLHDALPISSLSASEQMATDMISISRQARMIRTAISPLFAISIFLNIYRHPLLSNHKCDFPRCNNFSVYFGRSFSDTNRSFDLNDLNFQRQHISRNNFAAEFCFVYTTEKCDLPFVCFIRKYTDRAGLS